MITFRLQGHNEKANLFRMDVSDFQGQITGKLMMEQFDNIRERMVMQMGRAVMGSDIVEAARVEGWIQCLDELRKPFFGLVEEEKVDESAL